MIDVFILTNELDFSADRVIHQLRNYKSDINIVRINREDLRTADRFTTSLDQPGWLIEQIPKVTWLRQILPERNTFRNSPSVKEVDDILVKRRQWLAWLDIFEEMGTNWMNVPSKTHYAESKIRQMSLANRLGFEVPKTMITCSREDAIEFVSQFEQCIVKALATAFWEFSDQSFMFTVDAGQAIAADAKSWASQPVIVQEHIQGSYDARLLYVDGRIMGASRPRTSLDWRTSSEISWSRWTPGRDIMMKTSQYMETFGLSYGAFDFILESQKHLGPVFLECNPSGEFGFMDELLCSEPSQSTAQSLLKKSSRH
ncbi:MAG: hypothetical protein F4Z06_13005 [Acidimicrobiia bacterium]|nr:hypothetical protein [Acidimicrobiia bacterium]MYE72750.1 hypothetical protein [Acidimicrobiia bacterium]MYJ61881.1 hypothetical protein [Acidimicrobiia bacterium]